VKSRTFAPVFASLVGGPPCAVLVGEDTRLRKSLAEVCESVGLLPMLARSADDTANAVHSCDARLVVVLADRLQTSPSALFESLRPCTPRLVMMGPRFGGAEHVLALELGFHEVWPADLTPLALNALLRSSLRAALAELPSSNREVSFRDFTVDLAGFTCYDGRRSVTMSVGHVKTLGLLVERAPNVVGREELRAQMAPIASDLPATSRTVDVHVSRIRRQLVEGGVTRLRILHARGHGYRMVVANEEAR
jgi:DNA-binding response OmpR family regulator